MKLIFLKVKCNAPNTWAKHDAMISKSLIKDYVEKGVGYKYYSFSL